MCDVTHQIAGTRLNIRKTSFRKISWSLEAARFVFRILRSLWNLTGTSAGLLPMCLTISKRHDNLRYLSRGFETSRDLAKRRIRIFGYWDGALVPYMRPQPAGTWSDGGFHYSDVIMSAMASRTTRVSIVYSTVSGVDHRKHQSSAPPTFVWGIHRSPVDSPHKGL